MLLHCEYDYMNRTSLTPSTTSPCTIQVLMYTHYFITSLKIENPFKKQITRVQITQFYLCVSHAMVVSFLDYDDVFPKVTFVFFPLLNGCRTLL